MKCIVFVGDKPNKHNVHPAIPFVGTKSYKTLLGWIADMQLNIHHIQLDNAIYFKNWNYSLGNYKFVALGSSAEKTLKRMNKEYFKLPHPSGLNRKLNDKKWLNEQLELCKDWINND